MLVREFYRERTDGIKLYRTYSDLEHTIRQVQTGMEYSEAVDVENSPYTYEETDKTVETEQYEDTEREE